MDTEYAVKLKVRLKPVGQPWIRIAVADQHYQGQLCQSSAFDFEFSAQDSVTLTIEHYGKHINDADTAVEIVGIDFFGIQDPRFVWAGAYKPNYPQPWHSQQISPPPMEIKAATYLGWNGVYVLEFSVPVFTWIHQVQNLGWIYQ